MGRRAEEPARWSPTPAGTGGWPRTSGGHDESRVGVPSVSLRIGTSGLIRLPSVPIEKGPVAPGTSCLWLSNGIMPSTVPTRGTGLEPDAASLMAIDAVV